MKWYGSCHILFRVILEVRDESPIQRYIQWKILVAGCAAVSPFTGGIRSKLWERLK
jgi:hypothetical protein